MSLRSVLHEEPTISGVNIVPVIDLCLVLLIILMVTSPLLQTADLPVKLPQAVTIESKEKNVSVTLAEDGRLAVNTDMVQEDQLASVLQKYLHKDPEVLVILRVDKSIAYHRLTALIADCKRAGARNISIGTEQKKVER